MQLPRAGDTNQSPTDRSGRFAIKNVPAGSYFVVIDTPGIITPFAFLNFTQNGPPENWNAKEIKEYCTEVTVDGINDVEVTVRARRGGAISGKISYADGEPAINAHVNVIRKMGRDRVNVLTGINPAALLSLNTDDRGRYRIPALPPGEYILSVSEKHTAPDNPSQRYGDFGDLFSSDSLSATYYGGSGRAQDALAITVQANAEAENIDVILPELTTHTIGGIVTAHLDGFPLADATIILSNRDQAGWFMQGSQRIQANAEGRWSVGDVPDGIYLLTVSHDGVPLGRNEPAGVVDEPEDRQSRRERPHRRFVTREKEISVAGVDEIGIAIDLAEGASISGTIDLPKEGNERESYVFVSIRARYAEAKPNDTANSTTGYGGVFAMEGLRAGKVYLSGYISPTGIPDKSYYVKSITLNGTDLIKTPLTLSEGLSIKNVHVLVSSDIARAEIHILDQNGKPVTSKLAAIVPADRTQWTNAETLFSTVTSPKGDLSFVGAPGEYLIIVAGPDDGLKPLQELIRAQAETAPRINLQPGDNKGITVTLSR